MKKKGKLPWTAKELVAKGIPAVLIPGILLAVTLGWKGGALRKDVTYQELTQVFPHKGTILKVIDGDTFQLSTGQEVRLLGIDAPNRGAAGYDRATEELERVIGNNGVYLEYDRYQDDKYGRLLAWVWEGCEGDPRFLPADYMHDTNNRSKPGLTGNPEKCKQGTLVNESMAKNGYAEFVTYKDRGELKYQKRIEKYVKTN